MNVFGKISHAVVDWLFPYDDSYRLRIELLTDELERERIARRIADSKVEQLTQSIQDFVTSGCDHHEYMGITEFIQAGGAACPICLTAQIARLTGKASSHA